MKRVISTILALLFATSAYAQTQGGAIVTNGKAVTLQCTDNTLATLNLSAPNASSSINFFTGNTNRMSISGSGVISFPNGTTLVDVPYVPTLAATPNATANVFQGKLNFIPTNAANNAGLLPASPTAGLIKTIINKSGANQRIKPGGTDTITAGGTTGAAGAYTLIADGERVVCTATSTSAWECDKASAAPTPAGP